MDANDGGNPPKQMASWRGPVARGRSSLVAAVVPLLELVHSLVNLLHLKQVMSHLARTSRAGLEARKF